MMDERTYETLRHASDTGDRKLYEKTLNEWLSAIHPEIERCRRETAAMQAHVSDDEDKVFRQFSRDLIDLELSGAGMAFVFKPSEAFFLLGTLQLAMRHPQFSEHEAASRFIRGLAEEIEQRIGKTPALREVAARGWQKQFDA
jgi:hypothetical protein